MVVDVNSIIYLFKKWELYIFVTWEGIAHISFCRDDTNIISARAATS